MIAGDVGPDVGWPFPRRRRPAWGTMPTWGHFLIAMASTRPAPGSSWPGNPGCGRDKHYSVPRDVGWSAVVYNQDLFDDLGVEYPPETDFAVRPLRGTAASTTDTDKGYWGTNLSAPDPALVWLARLQHGLPDQQPQMDGKWLGLLDSPDSINAIQFILGHAKRSTRWPERGRHGRAGQRLRLGQGRHRRRQHLGPEGSALSFPFEWVPDAPAPLVPDRQEYCWGGRRAATRCGPRPSTSRSDLGLAEVREHRWLEAGPRSRPVAVAGAVGLDRTSAPTRIRC